MIILLVFEILLLHWKYSDPCDRLEESKFVKTPAGNMIQKYNRSITEESYRVLVENCKYGNKGVECTSIKHLGKTVTRSIQLIVTRMLHIVHLICDRYNIDYWLISGSLLGAYRTHSFIPWDIDGDIALLDTDYKRFVEVLEKELPKDLILIEKKNDPLIRDKTNICEARLRETNSCYGYCFINHCHWHDGVQIDVFLFHKKPDFETSRKLLVNSLSISMIFILQLPSSMRDCSFVHPKIQENFLLRCLEGALWMSQEKLVQRMDSLVSPGFPVTTSEVCQKQREKISS